MKQAGIYQIVNTVNGKLYIGSAVDVRRRWAAHRRLLVAGNHTNSYLQHAWNTYGADAFLFQLLEEVTDVARLIEREQVWIDTTHCYERTLGYNLSPTAYSLQGYRFSDEQRARVSAALKGKTKSPLHRARLWANRQLTDADRARMSANGRAGKGKPKTSEHRAKKAAAQVGAKNHRAKLTDAAVVEIKRRLANGERGRHLAAEFGVKESAISRIKTDKRWKHVRDQ